MTGVEKDVDDAVGHDLEPDVKDVITGVENDVDDAAGHDLEPDVVDVMTGVEKDVDDVIVMMGAYDAKLVATREENMQESDGVRVDMLLESEYVGRRGTYKVPHVQQPRLRSRRR